MTRTSQIITAALLLASASSVLAAPQKFGFSYEAKTLSKGAFEFENNMTWSHLTGENGFVFEHELEYGVTDNFQISALAEWEHTNVSGEGSDSAFAHAGLEGIYTLSNPSTDVIGSALLGEVAIGPEEFTAEARLLLSKDIGPITLAYNGGFAAVWEGSDYSNPLCEFEQTAGASYAFTPKIMTGVELIHDATFPDWGSAEANALYVGPNIGFRAGKVWGVITAAWEVTNDAASPDFMLKARVGINF